MNLPNFYVDDIIRRAAAVQRKDLYMKKFFAALLAISITASLAGCGNPVEERNTEDISENTAVVTEAAETVSETESAVSADIEAEDTTLKETFETTTETVTEKATDTENRGETFSADAESILGEWYAIDFIGMKNAAVTFGEDGSLSIARDGDTEIGTYTVSDGLVEVIYNGGEDWQAWAAVFDGDVLILKFIGLNREVIKEDYKPYDSGLSVGEYLDREGSYGIDYVLSRERSTLAEQEDILGVWYAENDDLRGLMIFNEQSCAELSLGDIIDIPVAVRNGRFVETGEMPQNISLGDERYFYLCGGKIYMIMCEDDHFAYDDMLILERYESVALTADMLDGSVGRDNETCYYFKDGQFYVFTEIADMAGYDFKIDGDKIVLPIDGKDAAFSYYVLGEDIYLMGEDINIAFSLSE